MPYTFIALLIYYIFQIPFHETDYSAARSRETNTITSENPCQAFNAFNNLIRDGLISKTEAKKRFPQMIDAVRTYYYANGGKDYAPQAWVFPVAGYTATQVGGSNGSGFIAGGYDYFDGNKHGGHPGHDIFVFDKDQNCIDDRTGEPIRVLSMTDGIVIATNTNWVPESPVRGGNYIWIFSPGSNRMAYYSHNKEIVAQIGQIVVPGDLIAYMGRTGNAAPKRSPTHVHMYCLELKNGLPVPKNFYQELCTIKTMK